MLDTVETLWDSAGLSDDLHMERFTIARTDNPRILKSNSPQEGS